MVSLPSFLTSSHSTGERPVLELEVHIPELKDQFEIQHHGPHVGQRSSQLHSHIANGTHRIMRIGLSMLIVVQSDVRPCALGLTRQALYLPALPDKAEHPPVVICAAATPHKVWASQK